MLSYLFILFRYERMRDINAKNVVEKVGAGCKDKIDCKDKVGLKNRVDSQYRVCFNV